MNSIREAIRLLVDDINECELLAALAVEDTTRAENLKRVAANRQLIAEAEQAVNSGAPT